jgi:hypothetical protein
MLFMGLDGKSKGLFIVWTLLGLVVYFAYGFWRSNLRLALSMMSRSRTAPAADRRRRSSEPEPAAEPRRVSAAVEVTADPPGRAPLHRRRSGEPCLSGRARAP